MRISKPRAVAGPDEIKLHWVYIDPSGRKLVCKERAKRGQYATMRCEETDQEWYCRVDYWVSRLQVVGPPGPMTKGQILGEAIDALKQIERHSNG